MPVEASLRLSDQHARAACPPSQLQCTTIPTRRSRPRRGPSEAAAAASTASCAMHCTPLTQDLRRLRCTPHSRETCTPSGRERRLPWACAVRFAPAQHTRTHTRLHSASIQPLAFPRTTTPLISCAALHQLHHASLGAVFVTQTPVGNPAQSSSHGDHGAPLLRPLVGMPRGVRRGGLRGGTAGVLVRSA